MIKYRDSGNSADEICPGAWYNESFRLGPSSFHAQFGFFRYKALLPFHESLRKLAESGAPISLVLGSNETDPISQQDLFALLPIFEGYPNARLSIVRFRGALFHPKVACAGYRNREDRALIGSANWTLQALSSNVEAWVEFARGPEANSAFFETIRNSINRWHSPRCPGARRIRCRDDVQAALDSGMILEVPAKRVAISSLFPSASHPHFRMPRRRFKWAPPKNAKSNREKKSALSASTSHIKPTLNVQSPANLLDGSDWTHRWCKKLSKSDAQSNLGHGTGLLRLTQAGQEIDQSTFFRYELFGDCNWDREKRMSYRGNSRSLQPSLKRKRRVAIYDATRIPLSVILNGVRLGPMEIKVDHATHRIAGQNNVPTVLVWGPAISEKLRMRSYAGFWVILERHKGPKFILRVQREMPDWRLQ